MMRLPTIGSRRVCRESLCFFKVYLSLLVVSALSQKVGQQSVNLRHGRVELCQFLELRDR